MASPRDDNPQDRVTMWVRLLLAEAHQTPTDLARGTGIDKASLSRSMSPTSQRRRGWTVDDLCCMAEFFGIEPAKFLEPPPDVRD